MPPLIQTTIATRKSSHRPTGPGQLYRSCRYGRTPLTVKTIAPASFVFDGRWQQIGGMRVLRETGSLQFCRAAAGYAVFFEDVGPWRHAHPGGVPVGTQYAARLWGEHPVEDHCLDADVVVEVLEVA